MIGITGFVCGPRGFTLRECLTDNVVPLAQIMIETDSPYMRVPECPKDAPNEPKYLPYVVRTLAACLKTTEEAVALATHANTLRFFPKMMAA